jgi:hypothetical protein
MTDLGTLDGPVLVFGGPYGNIQATHAMKAEAERLGVPPERTLCTGDLVAYCAAPAETVALIRDWGIPVVRGNCEESLAADADDCGCGFEEGGACDALSAVWYPYVRDALDAEAKAWMGALPRSLAFRLGGARFAVVHGAPSAVNRFVFASTPAEEQAAELDGTGADAVIGGHAGLPFEHVLDDGRLWLGAGVIGMPANDGTPRVWYAMIEPTEGALKVSLHALRYDHAAAAAAMRAEGLPEGYARCLETGLWPNMDVLPPAEREARGLALAETVHTWYPPSGVAS